MGHSKGRRTALKNIALATSGASLGLSALSCNNEKKEQAQENLGEEQTALKGNINHAACYWCYGDMPLDNFAQGAAELGLKGIDLLRPEEWEVAENHGLKCSVATDTFANIENGFNDPANHADLQAQYAKLIDKAAAKGIKNVIVFSGNRRDLSDEEGIANCAEGLQPLVKQAEENDVVLIMELLNSKVDHKDYQCDHTAWGAQLCERIGSDNFKLLYDIYHMQIMEGDVIHTIRDYNQYIAHYHTGGVPGRNEINASQELNYPAIMKAILETGYDGYVAQEFIPTYEDKLAALQEGVRICDV
ncbi:MULTISPECIES: TIM barrel protein [unclassified Leeuwenhoekiella]|uniref:hydroxypyruvate isomerase family protein n=1 Tax=unclassified Leeuwenhoekiella TaxID=2615029 RepID=UPI000C5CBBE0|nr:MULTISPECIES: TIM barrel protein [unclassified Leeuwenhoekiella]MAW94254.1 hydroxypyruvate isomerase [Leeuwenhoekiella sp.]MAW96832.1 hydroxypyruvate isomerase [Leeuwenhoekiella sp.]MBA80330.1 hydroxypyruvate isomerase [Leeuwenhoekiella sp.]|tara:strand:- start:55307 stop:56215 length:909 start_codon:yes stop_codon:yes gene_type:complete